MPNSSLVTLSYSLTELSEAAAWVIEKGRQAKIWCFSGQMGAGKTTLLREVCLQLGVQSSISSPSFSLVNEYQLANGKAIYHFDFYRIKSIEEVYDIGFEAYFDSGNICLVEWPEKIEEILSEEAHLRFEIIGEGNLRSISLTS